MKTKIKLYLIDVYDAYSAYDKNITAVRNLPKETIDFKYELLEEAEVELPEGFTVKKTKGGGNEIYYGDEYTDMYTNYNGKKFYTSVVSLGGEHKLHTWDYNFGK